MRSKKAKTAVLPGFCKIERGVSGMAVLPASNLLWRPWNCLVCTLISTIKRYGTLKISHLLLTKSLTSESLLLFIWLIDAAAVASRNFRFNSATLAVCFDENWIDFKSIEKPFASAWNCDEVRIFSILSWPTFIHKVFRYISGVI